MKQIVPFGDERVLAGCIYCGAAPHSRDHVPSRVLLDEPFPQNLPVVPSCRSCNNSFSLDEEYCAALIDCVTVGTAEPTIRHRAKVRRILGRQPALAATIQAARSFDPATGATAFAPDLERLKNVVLKLAKGHAAFELHTVEGDEPGVVSIAPLQLLAETAREAFETPPDARVFPEVGSRAMTRMFEYGAPSPSWIVVQPGRYRFLASPGIPLLVRVVIGEYLAGEVIWGQP
jgi:hypothetical protein